MPDSNYTITRYDYPILGGVAAHGYYALERREPDGTTTPIAALHGAVRHGRRLGFDCSSA